MKNFFTRTITGILFVVIMVGCILYNPLSFGFLFALVSMLTVFEFGQLVNQSGEVYISKILTSLGAAFLFLAFLAYSMEVSESELIKYKTCSDRQKKIFIKCINQRIVSET